MKVHAEWKHDEAFEAKTEQGNTIVLDGDSAHTYGPGPMEAVLMALCSCTSVDVISILQKKRQPFAGLKVSAVAEQAPAPPRVFTKIHLTYAVSGKGLSRTAVEHAVSLSKHKYCSVSLMLEKATKISYEIAYPDGETTE